jgi:hypothetical protein
MQVPLHSYSALNSHSATLLTSLRGIAYKTRLSHGREIPSVVKQITLLFFQYSMSISNLKMRLLLAQTLQQITLVTLHQRIRQRLQQQQQQRLLAVMLEANFWALL